MASEKISKAQQRYVSAADDLQKVIPDSTRGRLGDVTFPDFNTIDSTTDKAKALRDTLDKIVEAIPEGKTTQKKREVKKRIGDIVISCFKSSYPFANLFLTVAKDASAIPILNPYGVLCGGLLVLMKIAHEEIGKAKEIEKKLTFLTSVIGRLELNADIDIHHDIANAYIDNVECAALDVLASIMNYLTLVIRYFSKSLLGNIGKNIISPSTAFQDYINELNEAIQAYAAAMTDLELKLTVEMFKEGKDLQKTLEALFDQMKLQLDSIELKMQTFTEDQSAVRRKVQQEMDDDFLRWLSPSYWDVEAQLNAVQERRQEGTLGWVSEMPEFQQWADSDPNSRERIFWICGLPGIGKSIMAGHIIDDLKASHPSSIVAYFFFKKGEARLMNAANMICTIAYQCAKYSERVYRALQALRKEQFQISTVGISLLLKKLLKEPLLSTSEEIYVILDGLDEADREKVDLIDKLKRPEIELLVEGIAGLTSAHVLFISRPDVSILHATPLLIKKSLSQDNKSDIEIYVRTKLSSITPNFQKWYPKSAPEPTTFFVERSNGLFLWVSAALHQLSISKTKGQFNTYFNSLLKASGDMNKLYSGILERIVDEDRIWVLEILNWIVAAEEPLDIHVLKEIVEWSLDNERNFEEFLEIDCGSFIQITPGPESVRYVQLIHETFRSFLFDSKNNSDNYLIDESKVNGYAAIKCLDCLSVQNAPQLVVEYAAKNWVRHLSKSTSADIHAELLLRLFQLFTSDGITKWIQFGLLQTWTPDELDIDVEIRDIEEIMKWLQNIVITVDEFRFSGCNDDDAEVKAREWLHNILEQRPLGHHIGKAATRIWLYGNLTNSTHIAKSFRLGLKYYLMRRKNLVSNVEELEALSVTRFRDMYEWSNCDDKNTVDASKLAIAFSVLKLWNNCIESFEEQVNIKHNQFTFWGELGNAYFQRGDYDVAIEMFQNAVDKSPTDSDLWNRLGNAYEAKGDYEGALDTFKKVVHKFPTESSLWDGLFNAYKSKGEYDGAIETFQKAVDKFPMDSYLWGRLSDAYKAKGNYDVAIEIFQEAVDKFPFERGTWRGLSDIYKVKGDYNGAIVTLQKAVDKIPTDSHLWGGLGNAYKAKGDYDVAIETFKKMVDKFPTESYSWNQLGDAYKAKGDYDRAIETFQKAVDKFPIDWYTWYGLSGAYQAKGDYNGAIVTLQKAVDKIPTDSHLWGGLGNAYKAKGDYDVAIETFKKKVDKFPTESYSWNQLGDAYEVIGDYDRAIEIFQKAVDKFPTDSWSWNVLSYAYIAKGDYDVAIETFRIAIDKCPTHSYLWGGLCDAYKAKGYYDVAIETFKKMVDKFPTESYSWNQLGYVYEAKGDYDRAIETFQDAVDKFPTDLYLWDGLGGAYKAKGDYDVAIETFKKMVDKFPTKSSSWSGLGYAYKAKGDNDRAIETFQNVVDKFPTDSWSWNGLGDTYKAIGDYDRAIETFQKAVDKFPIDWNMWNGLGDAYKSNGNYDRAVETFQKALEKLPTESRPWNGLGDAYKARGDYDVAIETFQKAVDKFPMDYMLLFSLGDIYEVVGMNRASLNIYEQALEKSQNNSILWAYIVNPPRHSNYIGGKNILVNERIINSLFWHSITEAYKKRGELGRAIELYDMSIQGYQSTLSKTENELLWEYTGTSHWGGDIFWKSLLPKTVLWSALGEVYRIKAKTEESMGNCDQAMEDIASARIAFLNALELEQGNVWLNLVVRELGAA